MTSQKWTANSKHVLEYNINHAITAHIAVHFFLFHKCSPLQCNASRFGSVTLTSPQTHFCFVFLQRFSICWCFIKLTFQGQQNTQQLASTHYKTNKSTTVCFKLLSNSIVKSWWDTSSSLPHYQPSMLISFFFFFLNQYYQNLKSETFFYSRKKFLWNKTGSNQSGY